MGRPIERRSGVVESVLGRAAAKVYGSDAVPRADTPAIAVAPRSLHGTGPFDQVVPLDHTGVAAARTPAASAWGATGLFVLGCYGCYAAHQARRSRFAAQARVAYEAGVRAPLALLPPRQPQLALRQAPSLTSAACRTNDAWAASFHAVAEAEAAPQLGAVVLEAAASPPLAARSLVLEAALTQLGIDVHAPVDAALAYDILHHDMLLDDFPLVRDVLLPRLEKGASFAPMFDKMRSGLLRQHPALVEVLQQLVERGWLKPVDAAGQQLVWRAVHTIFLLNELTVQMVHNRDTMRAIVEHLFAKREGLGLAGGILHTLSSCHAICGEWFTPAKAATMDVAIGRILADRFSDQPRDVWLKTDTKGLRLNIMEAMLTDKAHGFADNFLAGAALEQYPPQWWMLTSDGHYGIDTTSPEWASLYETWNFAFITGNLKNLQLLYPKLLLPVLLDAAPGEYLTYRAVSLWLAINFQLFAQQRGINMELPHQKAMAQLWGSINAKYARAYLSAKQAPHRTEASCFATAP